MSMSFCKSSSWSLSSPDDRLSENILFVRSRTSYSRDRLLIGGKEIVDSPTQLVRIWIFICWVGGGNPCGGVEFCISGSCRNRKHTGFVLVFKISFLCIFCPWNSKKKGKKLPPMVWSVTPILFVNSIHIVWRVSSQKSRSPRWTDLAKPNQVGEKRGMHVWAYTLRDI